MGVILKFKFLSENDNHEFEEQLRASRTEYEQHCIAFVNRTLELRCSDAAHTGPVDNGKTAIGVVRIQDDRFRNLGLNEQAVELLQKECSVRFARTLCDILMTYVRGAPEYLTHHTSNEIRDHAQHWAGQDANLFTQLLLGNFDLTLESKVRQTLTYKLNREMHKAIEGCYWSELAVPFIQMIPSLQEGAGDEEDHADEGAVHSGDNAGTDTPPATEAQEPIEGLPSSERDRAVSPAQADEGVQEAAGYYSVSALAQKHGVPREALDQRLRRFRNKDPFGFKYIKDGRPAKARTGPSYVYLEPTIMHHVKALKPKRHTKRKPPETLQFGDP